MLFVYNLLQPNLSFSHHNFHCMKITPFVLYTGKKLFQAM